jgi:hypothetical protein
MKFTKINYCQYLLSSQTNYTITNLAEHLQDVSHDRILHCILDHARQNFTGTKVLISGNNKDFGTSEVQEALHNAGIVKYFASTRSFLGWLESQS